MKTMSTKAKQTPRLAAPSQDMREIGRQEYEEFRKSHNEVLVEGKHVKLVDSGPIGLLEPEDFHLEKTSVWSFENRGKWATHRGNYRGNWTPEIPRNLILRYSKPGDVVLDQMVGSGTTLVECKLTERNGIGIDINMNALMVAWNRIDFTYSPAETRQRLFLGDARRLNLIDNESIDLIATHPPYANIIPFSKRSEVDGDLSQVHTIGEFITGIQPVAQECFRVLKAGGHCGILIGDTHKHKHYVPISFRVLEAFLDSGFVLREDVIKKQWHTETMRGRWRESYNHDFLLIFHEHLFIFRKPEVNEQLSKFRESMKWR